MKKIAIRFCIVMLFLLASFQLYSYAQVDRPALVNTEGRSFQLGTVTAVVKDNLQENGSRMGDQIVRVQVQSADGKGRGRTSKLSQWTALWYCLRARNAGGIDFQQNRGFAAAYGIQHGSIDADFLFYCCLFTAAMSGRRQKRLQVGLGLTVYIYVLLLSLLSDDLSRGTAGCGGNCNVISCLNGYDLFDQRCYGKGTVGGDCFHWWYLCGRGDSCSIWQGGSFIRL